MKIISLTPVNDKFRIKIFYNGITFNSEYTYTLQQISISFDNISIEELKSKILSV